MFIYMMEVMMNMRVSNDFDLHNEANVDDADSLLQLQW